MMINGGQKERAIFLLWLGIFWISVIFMSNSFGWYLIYVWPIFALWLTRTIMACCKIHRRSWMHWALGILIFCYIANLALWTGKALSGPPYAAIAQELRLAIPLSSSVVAGGEWWFALHDRDYTDAQHAQFRTFLARVKNELKPSGWEKSWDQLKWQFVVAHGDIQAMLDCEIPLKETMVSVRGRREEEIREAREFSLNYCVVQKRIETASTPVLVLKIKEEKSHVAR
jgi:hypothetical protein